MLNDLKKFCVIRDSPWADETTFKVVDELWLINSSYTNFSLINKENKHPQLPRPSRSKKIMHHSKGWLLGLVL